MKAEVGNIASNCAILALRASGALPDDLKSRMNATVSSKVSWSLKTHMLAFRSEKEPQSICERASLCVCGVFSGSKASICCKAPLTLKEMVSFQA